MNRKILNSFMVLVSTLVFVACVGAQTSVFVYQGKLQDGNLPANGNYQFEFKLYDAASGGNQIGPTLSDINAAVSGGIFAVNLDFGAAAFDGPARYLDVSVRLSNAGQSYTLLNPREPISSTPYALKSLKAEVAVTATTAANSVKLGGVAASEYVQTQDPRMSDPRTPLPNSAYYIQNSANQQSSSNFNISGEGKANILSAAKQYNIGGNRAFHLAGTENTFVGFETGNSITSGSLNAVFGTHAGKGTTTGINNSFFGAYAGRDNVTGGSNAFFGTNAGLTNNSSFNAFFGSASGLTNYSGSNNSYFGNSTGVNNSTGGNNSFFGSNSGKSVANASFNSFVGSFSGEKTTTGAGNTFIGTFAGRENTIGFNNVYIGYKAAQAPTTGNSNVIIGYNSTVTSGVSNSIAIGANITIKTSNTTKIGGDSVEMNDLYAGDISGYSVNSYGDVWVSGKVNAGKGEFSDAVKATSFEATSIDTSKFKNLDATDTLRAYRLEFGTGNVGGNTPLCMRNGSLKYYDIIPCSSSLRYKDNVQNYTRGLDLLHQLRPVTFDWKNDGTHDVGFIAEEVNKVEPLLNTYNTDGVIEGVRYAQITTVLVNAVKEQQVQIETQTVENQRLASQIKQQQAQIDALKAMVCSQSRMAPGCQPIKH